MKKRQTEEVEVEVEEQHLQQQQRQQQPASLQFQRKIICQKIQIMRKVRSTVPTFLPKHYLRYTIGKKLYYGSSDTDMFLDKKYFKNDLKCSQHFSSKNICTFLEISETNTIQYFALQSC